jgi:hypothetical protein
MPGIVLHAAPAEALKREDLCAGLFGAEAGGLPIRGSQYRSNPCRKRELAAKLPVQNLEEEIHTVAFGL